MTTPAANKYPINPQGQDALKFRDPGVTNETALMHTSFVEYTDETTIQIAQPGDGFIIGLDSKFKYGDGFSEYVIDTDKARYYGGNMDAGVFVRRPKDEAGKLTNRLEPFDNQVLGDGISGRVGQTISLPGSEEGETVSNMEFRYKIGVQGDQIVNTPSPFDVAEDIFEVASQKIEIARGLGEIAVDNN